MAVSAPVTLRQIGYFVGVARAGSVTAAAEAAHVSAPSVSAGLAQLEAALGLPLFVRRRARGLSLTQAGRQILAQAERVLSEAEALGRLAGDLAGDVRGPLAVGCLLSFAQIILPGLRRGFEGRYPDVRIRQSERDQEGIFEGLRRAEIDVALSYDMDIPGDLRFEPLMPLAPYAMMSPDHPLAHCDAVTPEALAPHPMILLDLPHSAAYFLSFFAGMAGRPRIAERTRDMAVMRSLVANGFGYGIANVRPVSPRAPDGKPLVFVPLESGVAPMRLGLVMAQGAENLLIMRAFAEHARAYLEGPDAPRLGL